MQKILINFPYKVGGIHLDLHDVSQEPHGDLVKECGTSQQLHLGSLEQLFSWMSLCRKYASKLDGLEPFPLLSLCSQGLTSSGANLSQTLCEEQRAGCKPLARSPVKWIK